jgi:putative MFS transporter
MPPVADPIARLDAITRWPYERKLLAIVGAAWFFAYFDIVNIGYALPAITEQFGARGAVIALVVTLSLLGCIVGALADGVLADRYGRRIALVLSVATYSIGTILAACAPDITVLAVGRFITGIGIGAEIAVASAYIAELAPAGMRGRATSMTALCGYAAFALIPFIALFLLSNFEAGWRILLLIGALGALVVLPFRTKLPASPRWMIAQGRSDEAEAAVAACEARVGPEGISTATPSPVAPGEARDFRKYLALFLGIWFLYLIVDDAWLTLPTTLLTDRGMSVTASIAALSPTGLGCVAGAVLAIKFGERVERKFLIIGALFIWAVVLAVIGVFPALWVIAVFGFVSSMVVGFAGPLLYAYTGEHFESQNRARGISITNGIGHVGGALCPYIVLPAAAVSFALGFAVMAAIAVAATVLVALGRRMNGRRIA